MIGTLLLVLGLSVVGEVEDGEEDARRSSRLEMSYIEVDELVVSHGGMAWLGNFGAGLAVRMKGSGRD